MRYKMFKDKVNNVFSIEMSFLLNNLREVYSFLCEEEVSDFIQIFEDNGSSVKIRPFKEEDKSLYLKSKIDNFNLLDYPNSLVIVDHIWGSNGFLFATDDGDNFFISQISLDSENNYFISKDGSNINSNFKCLDYALFLLETVLDSFYE